LTFVTRFTKNPFTLILAIMIIYVAFAFYVDIGKLSKMVLKIDYWTIPLILAPMTANILVLAFRFHLFLRVLNIKISIKKSILIYISGISLTATPGSSGQAIKSQIMKNQLGYALSKTLPVVLIEKWNELIASLLVLIILALIGSIIESILIIIIGATLAVFILGIMRHHTFFNSFKKIIRRFRRLKIFEESIENSQDALKVLSSKKVVIEGVIITVPAVILQAISVYFAFHALGIKITFVLSTQIFYVALISGILSFLPGGLGITEGSMVALLHKYYNHDLALLAGAVIFVRLATLWYPTLIGIIIGQFILKYKNILSRQDYHP
jgi:glycosyltransferase 2 family protein